MNYAEALEHKASVQRSKNTKPVLAHLRVEKAEIDGENGHSVEHHFENGNGTYHEPETKSFSKWEGEKPQLPEGHVLQHIAKHLGIAHEIIGKEKGAQSEEPEKEADED